jgi:serine/threonine-protein kinase
VGPQRLGRYEIVGKIASGGMGSVYRARTDRPRVATVALKVIHPHLAEDPAFIRMFLDEGRLAARLRHPNICRVLDLGHDDGIYYIVMEHLVGAPLVAAMQAMRVDPAADAERAYIGIVARVLADACHGLHAAHEAADSRGEPLHVVHRDVSPHNLFVTTSGVTKVMDFGIARARDRLHSTATGELKGKWAYMAPEQLLGQDVDRRADVWALGVVAWEMLTRRRLFASHPTMAAVVQSVLQQSIVAPSAFTRSVPPALDAVVLRALSRDRLERYGTSVAFAADLLEAASAAGVVVGTGKDVADWLGSLPIPAAPAGGVRDPERAGAAGVRLGERLGAAPATATDTSSPTSSWAFRRRPRWVVALASVVIGVVCGAIGLYAGLAHAPVSAPPLSAVSANTTSAANDSADTAADSPDTDSPDTDSPDTNSDTAADSPDTNSDTLDTTGTGILDTTTDTSIAIADGPAAARRANAAGSDDRDPPRRASAAAAPATGTVVVGTPGGWARVYLGARLVGETPLRAELPAGTHRLRLLPYGEGPARIARVRVRPHRVARVEVPLAR